MQISNNPNEITLGSCGWITKLVLEWGDTKNSNCHKKFQKLSKSQQVMFSYDMLLNIFRIKFTVEVFVRIIVKQHRINMSSWISLNLLPHTVLLCGMPSQ